ncbi:MAG: TRAP transporter large permease subunit [Thermoleophilia bacterium]|nr:TRAP transporter large permease subunit [Thermoleophilia bacterium]
MTVAIDAPVAGSRGSLTRTLDWLARWLEVYSQAAIRIAMVITVVTALAAMVALAGNVFTRNTAGFSIFGAEEFARFCFLWTIWMGVSLAVKRGSVTVITLLSHNGPTWWQHGMRTFSGISLGALLAYACWRSTEYAMTDFAREATSPGLEVLWFYPIVSMTVGYYFITLHFATGLIAGAATLSARAAAGWRTVLRGAAGGLAIGFAVWLIVAALLALGVSDLVAIGVIFVALTMAGTPIVFMLSMVGIIAMRGSFLGLEFFPDRNFGDLTPFETTQFTMGLSGGGELLVILMFLIVAEVMNASGMSARLIAVAAAAVGHLRGGMAYVAQVTSALVSGISGSAQADAAIMTPLLVPAMEKEGYRRDVAAAVVAGASIKGPIGPISIMFIVYGTIVEGPASASISELLLSGVFAELLLLIFQAATVYIVVRRLGFLEKKPFAGVNAIASSSRSALPVLAIPFIILGGIFTGVFTPTEAASVAAVVTLFLAFFWYRGISPSQLPGIIAIAGLEAGIVLLLLGDSSILAKVLFIDRFGEDLQAFMIGISDNRLVFLLVVNLLLLAVGIFIEPLPALFILAPFLAPIAVEVYGVDPVHFGLIMVFNLVLALIHPPIGLVIFLVSSLANVSVERLSVMILPWLGVSLIVLFIVTYLPSDVVLVLSRLVER